MLTTSPFAALTTRLATPARLLAARLGKGRMGEQSGSAAQDRAEAGPVAVLEGRLHAAILPQSPMQKLWQAQVDEAALLAEAGQWRRLFDSLRQADRDRAAAPAGRRLACLISEGARAALAKPLACKDWTAALAELDRLVAVQAAHPADPMAAAVLALAHLDYGWARRAANLGPAIPREAWAAFTQHTRLAEAVLDGFDPIEEDSPHLARARYLLVRGIEDGDALCRDWYEDWSDLDPSNAEPHVVHAEHLLPQWFGTFAGFEPAARRAMKRTQDRSGAAAYALFHRAAAKVLGELAPGADIKLYIKGLQDYYAATPGQHHANQTAAALAALLADLIEIGPEAHEAQLVRQALSTHLRQNLREIHLSTWEQGAIGVSQALREVFGAELGQGAHLYASETGLVAKA
ncbi:hypothetical protein Q9295_14450 [Xinfangfangia sp. CPCC 101601]|uniref:DUF4034 domain-containing protein n=1 Tax=Pseudogemmobacter lacusdianii TaxID=3069608 RepID=A0ABU0W0N8_9RHOB|nr:hypothetical protein [Xinfangfangia sp. CPCC 101601]MDQ2067576.1 hypothetical protein [Xinfangfangia sp. CPCC 101601]